MSTRAKPKPKPKAQPGPTPKDPPPPIPAGCEALLSRLQVCAALAISPRDFDAMRATGEYPEPDVTLGRRPRWRVATHNEWLRARCRKGES